MPRKPKISIRKLLKTKIRGNQTLCVGFQFYGPEIPGWTMLRKKMRPNRDGLRISTYIYQLNGPAGSDKRIKLEIIEGRNRTTAPDNMQRFLNQSMAAQLMGPGEDAGIDLGDGSIVNTKRSEAGELLDFLIFSRANLTGKFNSIGDTPISVVEFAEGMDGFFARGKDQTDFTSATEIECSPESRRMRVGETQEFSYRRLTPTENSNWWWFLANTSHCDLSRDENDRVFFTPSRVGKVDFICLNLDEVIGRSVAKFTVTVLP